MPIGSGRSTGSNCDVLLADILAILNVVAINDSINGALNFRFGEIEESGTIQDPTGKVFYGAIFKFDVEQLFEV